MSHLEERRRRAARAWALTNEVVLIPAGEPIPIPGAGDPVYPFLPHPEHRYLADQARPGHVLAFDPGEGWTLFVPEIAPAQRIWEDPGPPLPGEPRSALPAWLGERRGRPLAVLGCPLEGVRDDPELRERLREALRAVRRPKDAVELERMRRACAATARGFARAREGIQPGATERAVQIEIEAEFFRAGGERTAYDTIVGSGPNSAVLHFAPTARAMRKGELVLIDAGAEIEGYAADVTRTYPAGGGFTPEQGDLYAALLEAQENAIARCRAGAQFRENHLATCVDLARGLLDFGLLRGDPQGLVERDAHALFFPHGLGHMVGLGVRDGMSAPTREPIDRPGLRYLRLDAALEPGYTVTIEPGIYFIPALLEDPLVREQWPDCVDWERVDRLRGFGGLRIEDNVLVTRGDPEVLTAAIPK